MDENQLVDEILILFAAGHETTSNALIYLRIVNVLQHSHSI
jgi:cytochrome P450